MSGPVYGECPACLQTLRAGHVCPVYLAAGDEAARKARGAASETLSEFERARIDSQRNNKAVTPEQLLRLALDDLRRGEVKADAALVYLILKPEGDVEGKRAVYRANFDRMEEVAYLEYFKMRTLEDWKNS